MKRTETGFFYELIIKSIFKDRGWAESYEGGGCKAFMLELPNDQYLLATTEDGMSLPDNLEKMLVCSYNNTNDMLEDYGIINWIELLALVSKLTGENNES